MAHLFHEVLVIVLVLKPFLALVKKSSGQPKKCTKSWLSVSVMLAQK